MDPRAAIPAAKEAIAALRRTMVAVEARHAATERQLRQKIADSRSQADDTMATLRSERQVAERRLAELVRAPPADGADLIDQLPDDVLVQVLLLLPLPALFRRCNRVSRRWRRLVGSNQTLETHRFLIRHMKQARGDLGPGYFAAKPQPDHCASPMMIRALVTTADGQLFAGLQDGQIIACDASDVVRRHVGDTGDTGGAPVPEDPGWTVLGGHAPTRVLALAVSLDQNILYSGADEDTGRRWSTGRAGGLGTRMGLLAGHCDAVLAIAVCPRTGLVYTGTWGATIMAWACDGAHLRERRLQYAHPRPAAAGFVPTPQQLENTAVNALAVSPVDGRLYAGLSTGTIRILDSECDREMGAIDMTAGAGCTVLEMSREGHLYGGDKHGVLLRVHRRELDAIGTRPPVVLRVLAGRGVVRALALGNGLVYAATARPRATTELGAEILVFTADLSPLCTLVDHVVPMTGILAITVRGADGRVFAGSTCGRIRVW